MSSSPSALSGRDTGRFGEGGGLRGAALHFGAEKRAMIRDSGGKPKQIEGDAGHAVRS